MCALLGRLVAAAQRAEQGAARAIPLGCLAQVLRAFGETHAGPRVRARAATAVPGLVEPPTPRELEVPVLLAAGPPNQAIAGELVVSLDMAQNT